MSGNNKEIVRAAEKSVARAEAAKLVESLVVRGDISGLNPEERATYYWQMCEQLGLNPHAQPFAFLRLNGKEILYATRGATDQLAAIHKLNREIVDGPRVIDIAGTKVGYAVCRATHPNGRTETATATAPLVDPVNLYMKLETKAKRRATLSILGLGLLDEVELETIPAHAQQPGGGVDLSLASIGVEAQRARRFDDVYDAHAGNNPSLGEHNCAVEAAERATHPLSARELEAILAQIAGCRVLADLVALRSDLKPEYGRADEGQQRKIAAAFATRKRELTPPPDGTDGDAQRSGEHARAEGAANDTVGAEGPQGSVVAMDARAYFAAKTCRKALENAVRAHGKTQSDAWHRAASERLVALDTPSDDGARLNVIGARQLVDRWSVDGPAKARAVPRATGAAQTRRRAG